MYHHRLVVSYKGTNYFGWQDLNDKEKPTVQASIHQILKKICNYETCAISAASRTDAGVHAQGQVIKISIPLVIKSAKLLLGMNSLLPDDIRILICEPCASTFNPNKESKSKEYHYYFCTDTIYNPIFNDTVAHIPTYSKDSTLGTLDRERMQQASNLFIGEHDFYNFSKRDSTMCSTLRTVLSCEILQTQPKMLGNKVYYIKIVGKGFLRHMIRYIAGAVFAHGRDQLSLNDMREALVNHKEKKICSKAKSRGLHLIHISYLSQLE